MASATFPSHRGSRHGGGGFDRDMQEFLLHVEVSAKQIIRKEAKKRIAEAKRQQAASILELAASHASSSSSSSPSRKRRLPPSTTTSTFLIQPETLGHPSIDGKDVDLSNIGPIKFSRPDMSTSISKMAPGQKMFVSTPYAQAGEGSDAMGVTTNPVWTHTSGVMVPELSETSSLALSSMSSIDGGRLPPLSSKTGGGGGRAAAIRQKFQQVVAAGVEKIAPILFNNPLYKPLKAASETKGGKKKERQIQSDNFKVTINKDRLKSSAIKPRRELRSELQGPISWTSEDIRYDIRWKYRSESSRESAWIASKAAQLAADRLRETEGIIMPVPYIERHPVLVWYHSLVKGELRFALERARARYKMKRFVSDLHTIWMTNLQALREHSFKTEEKAVPRGHGLDERRDVSAIVSLSSQIQSVAKDRAIRNALFTTHEAPPIDLEPPASSADSYPPSTRPSPTFDPLPTPPPRIWHLVEGEPVYIKAVRRFYRCFIARFGEGPDRLAFSEAVIGAARLELLWRIQLYDVADGTETSLIIPEQLAVDAVRQHVLEVAKGPVTPEEDDGDEGGDDVLERKREALIHQQAVRIPIIRPNQLPAANEGAYAEDVTKPMAAMQSLVTISIHHGPHESVIVEIKAFPYRPIAIKNTPLVLRFTSAEARARLNWHEAPVSDLEWWRTAKKEADVWRRLVSMLRYQTMQSVEDGVVMMPTSLEFDDGGMIEKEGFDFYGTAALALGIIPLLRLSTQQVQAAAKPSIRGEGGSSGGQQKRGSCVSTAPIIAYKMSILEMKEESLVVASSSSKGSSSETDEQPLSLWEDQAEFNTPTTLRVSGLLEALQSVPGVCVWGRLGLWYPHPQFPPSQPREYGQGIAYFFRDHTISSTDSILVWLSLSLETPVMTPMSLAWETKDLSPPSPPHEEVDGIVPPLIAEPVTHLRTPVNSLVDYKKAGTIMIMTQAAVPSDYTPLDKAHQNRQGHHLRFTPTFNQDGFRQVESFPLLKPKLSLSTFVFGITNLGATASPMRTTGRFIWHSEQRAVEEIVRRRTPKDYVYISRKRQCAGLSLPKVFTVCTRHGRFFRLAHGGLKELAKEYEKVAKKEEAIRRKETLQRRKDEAAARIVADAKAQELLEMQLKAKEMASIGKWGNQELHRSSLQRWSKRLAHSSLLATRGQWEKRKHELSGNVFWHHIGGGEGGRSSSSFAGVRAFSYDPPTEDWVAAEVASAKGQELPAIPEEESMADTSVGVTNTSAHAISITEGASLEGGGRQDHDGEESKLEAELGKKQVKRLEDILEGLSTNNRLIERLADRIGAHAFVPLLKRDATVDPLNRELEEDDRAWSDSEDEIGDDEYEPGSLPPQDWAGMYQEQKRDKKILAPEVIQSKPQQRPGVVPVLPIKERLPPMSNDLERHVAGQGWRCLPRPQINAGFVKTVLGRRTQGPRSSDLNQPCKPRLIGAQDPRDQVIVLKKEWTPDKEKKMETRFVANAVAEMEASIQAISSRLDREGKLANGGAMGQQMVAMSTAGLDLGPDLSSSETVNNTAPSALMAVSTAKAATAEQLETADRIYKAEQSAIAAVKAGNFDRLEAAIDAEMININVADEYGNTLLILASQQGSKKMVKFLLRRGANINLQNIAGNTVLHYAYAYNHEQLGHYLESKGANSGLLNAAGLTCYEGLNREDLDSL